MPRAPRVYIVTVSVPAAVIRDRVARISGLSYIRELPPGHVVVAAGSAAAAEELALLPGVISIREDRPGRPL